MNPTQSPLQNQSPLVTSQPAATQQSNTAAVAPTQNIQNPAPKAISVADLSTPTTPLQVPTPAPVTQVAPVETNLAQTALNNLQVEETANQKQARELSQSIASLLPQTAGQGQALAQAQDQLKINEMSKNLGDINSQILLKQADLNKDDVALAQGLQNIEDKPIAMEFITGQQASVQRQAQLARAWKNAEINTLNARATALQGNISLAQQMAKDAVAQKYAPVYEALDIKQAQLKALDPLLSADEKKQASEQQIRTQFALQDIKQRQENESKIQELIMNGAQFGASQSLLTQASQAKTPMQAAMILGAYGGKDYLQNQKLRAEIAKISGVGSGGAVAGGTGGTTTGAATTLSNGKPASSTAQNYLAQINAGKSYDEVLKEIGTTDKRAWLRDEVIDLYAKQGNKPILAADNPVVQGIQQQIGKLDILLSGYKDVSGTIQGGLGILPDKLNIYKQDTLNAAKEFMNSDTLKQLADAKSKGVTFGALSEGELALVAGASNALAASAIKDKDGNITGFTGSEATLKKNIETIKDNLKKAIQTKTGGTTTSIDDYINEVDTSLNKIKSGVVNEDDYINSLYQ